jgi:hypothetical protein
MPRIDIPVPAFTITLGYDLESGSRVGYVSAGGTEIFSTPIPDVYTHGDYLSDDEVAGREYRYTATAFGEWFLKKVTS